MPGLRGALSVRVNDGQTDRIVNRYASGLKFTKVAPGGHKSISVHLNLPRNTFNDLGPEDRIYVSDARSARTIIEGYLENPTPIEGRHGQAYDLSAVGGMALANDETRSLIYITTDLGTFEKGPDSGASGDVDVGKWANNTAFNRVRTTFASGQVLATGSLISAANYAFQRAGMNLGALTFGDFNSGKTDANYACEFVTTTGTVVTGTMSTAGPSLQQYVGAANFPSGTQYFAVRIRRTGLATNVADDQTWTDWTDFFALGQRMDRNGTLLTGSGGLGSATTVLASQVVEDLLGRLLTFCDPATAQVDVTSYTIGQLAYPDGVKAAGVLNDLAVFEPGYLWEILESNDAGKHRFNYRAWPTTPRYEVSTRDDWRQQGSDVDLCNRILVSWTDATGATQVTPVTAASLGLTGLGYRVDDLGARVKDADPITLPEGYGSAANATRIGGQILTDKINPPKAGTILVRRPIVDQLTGNVVMPWEIEPGYLCRVRELGDDLRITQVDYDDDNCEALLTLGTPVLTDDQRLARLDRVTPTVLTGT